MHLASQIKGFLRLPVPQPSSRFEDEDSLALICHEIRTPLNAIVGLAAILADPKTSPAKQKKSARLLTDSACMLTELLNNFLDSSRLGHDGVELNHVIFDLNQVLEEARNIVAVKAEEKGLDIRIRTDKGRPALFVGDPFRIRQILLNLLGNAIKFTPKGTVSIHMTEEEGVDSLSEVRITVADCGIGIERERLATIFDKYSQGHASISRNYGGTGLGLYISQELAHLMGGRILVKSRYRKGSHFTVTLPLRKAGLV